MWSICACVLSMDSITQAALGGLMGELVLGRQLGFKGVLWGIAFGTVPDLDVFMAPFLSEAEEMRNHRGISHSLLAICLMPFLFGPLLGRLHDALSWRRGVWFVFLTWSTHVLIDCFNTYGTQIFEPFSDERVVLGNISIVDLSFTLPMLVTLVMVARLGKHTRKRVYWAWGCTGWLLFYVALSFVVKGMADSRFREELEARGIRPLQTMSGPSFGNIILWRCLAESEEALHVSYWSLFDRDRPYDIVSIPKNHELLGTIEETEHGEAILWFCQGWHAVVPGKEGQFGIIDMRLGEMVTEQWRAPVFSWIVDDEGMQVAVFRAAISSKEALVRQWGRMWGGVPDWSSAEWIWLATSATDEL